MTNTNKCINILMCCSDLSVKGGMVSVVKNYLGYQDWDDVNLVYIPTHIEKGPIVKIFFYCKAVLKIISLCARGKIDIAHLHTAERGSFYRKALILIVCKFFGIKSIMHHHGAEFELFYSRLSRNNKRFVNLILDLVDINLVLSNRLISMIKDKSPKANVEVLYNAVNDYDNNPYNPDAKNILFLGRLGKRKGTYDLLKVIKELDDRIDTNIKFYLCGDGDIEGITKKIKELDIETRIAHIGWIDSKQKKEILSKTCINILPSYNEGLPMTILETMSHGIPNISTNIASIPEVIIHDVNGYLIEPGDIIGMEDRLEKLINDRSTRITFSINSYEMITKYFSLNKHILHLDGFYKKLFQG